MSGNLTIYCLLPWYSPPVSLLFFSVFQTCKERNASIWSALPAPWGYLVYEALLLLLLKISIIASFPHVTQILKGILEGASHILPAFRVLSSLLSSCSDSVALYSFCREAGLPGLPLSLLRHSQESNSLQQVSTRTGASEDSQRFFFLDLSHSDCHLSLV